MSKFVRYCFVRIGETLLLPIVLPLGLIAMAVLAVVEDFSNWRLTR
jgi:hypothetical protein